ncbi:TPA: helix-turn-helix transcriptional regulator [Legionella feeleii]
MTAHQVNPGCKQPGYASDYVDNPVALARIQAGLTQEELASLMGVTQAYISGKKQDLTLGIVKSKFLLAKLNC